MPSIVITVLAAVLVCLLAYFPVNNTLWYWVVFLYVVAGICLFWELRLWPFILWLIFIWITVIGYMLYPFATTFGG